MPEHLYGVPLLLKVAMISLGVSKAQNNVTLGDRPSLADRRTSPVCRTAPSPVVGISPLQRYDAQRSWVSQVRCRDSESFALGTWRGITLFYGGFTTLRCIESPRLRGFVLSAVWWRNHTVCGKRHAARGLWLDRPRYYAARFCRKMSPLTRNFEIYPSSTHLDTVMCDVRIYLLYFDIR